MTDEILRIDDADFAAALLVVGAPVPYRYHRRRSGGLADDLVTLYSPEKQYNVLAWMEYYSALATWLEERYGKRMIKHSSFVVEWVEQYEKWFYTSESNLTQCVKGD